MGSMDRGREDSSHQLPGVTRCVPGSESILQGEEGPYSPPETRNSTAIVYINHLGGTRSSALCSLATEIWSWCLRKKIFLMASHVPGVQNIIADRLSRSIVDRHDWMLNKTVFRQLNSLWGPLSVDLFATRTSRQLPRYFSWKPDPQEECLCTDVVRLQGLCEPSLVTDREVHSTNQEPKSHSSPGDTPVDLATMHSFHYA